MSLPSLLMKNVGSTVPLVNLWESRNDESKSYQACSACSNRNGFLKLVHMVGILWTYKPVWLTNVELLTQYAIQKCGIHIHLVVVQLEKKIPQSLCLIPDDIPLLPDEPYFLTPHPIRLVSPCISTSRISSLLIYNSWVQQKKGKHQNNIIGLHLVVNDGWKPAVTYHYASGSKRKLRMIISPFLSVAVGQLHR
ncbi:hypothetical protein Tco_0246763 [Tanacetum coccineum]